MPSIVVINGEGTVLYQNVVENVQGLMKTLIPDGALPGYSGSAPPIRVNGLIVFAEQPPISKGTQPNLSLKQTLVLQHLAKARTPGQIAIKLGVSEATVRMHIRALKNKFGTDSRDQMMAMAGSLGLCNPFDEKPTENLQKDSRS